MKKNIIDNSYFILSSKKDIEILRFHFCTWDLLKDNAIIEFGFEITNKKLSGEILELHLSIPYLDNECKANCLYSHLTKDENSKFIFNDAILGIDFLNANNQGSGISMRFAGRSSMSILPCLPNIEVKNKIVSLSIDCSNLDITDDTVYVRFVLHTNRRTISIYNKDISKGSYTFDIKLNERRNQGKDIANYEDKHKLSPCIIKSFFCFHIYPEAYSIQYIDNSKLKSIRKLEAMPFSKYLSDLKSLKDDKYTIIFNKVSDKNANNKTSYSSYTVLNREIIGYKQIVSAITANIICSLLFAFASIRSSRDPNIELYKQIPYEYWLAMGILLVIIIMSLIKLCRNK